MSWLKRQQPIRLYQGLDIPYVILADGVHLCCDNCYGTQENVLEHNICFKTSITNIKRINTYFYKISHFPFIVPFSDIISLDDAIIEGRTIKHAGVQGDLKNIAIMKPEYIRHTADTNLTGLSNTLDEFDASFILTGENIDPQIRLFEESSKIIYHRSWFRTLITIADCMCEKNISRKYCWTQNVPELSVSCYGIESTDELAEINDTFASIGIGDVSVTWVD